MQITQCLYQCHFLVFLNEQRQNNRQKALPIRIFFQINYTFAFGQNKRDLDEGPLVYQISTRLYVNVNKTQ